MSSVLHSPQGHCALGSKYQSRENWSVSDLSTYITRAGERFVWVACVRARGPEEQVGAAWLPELVPPLPSNCPSLPARFPQSVTR